MQFPRFCAVKLYKNLVKILTKSFRVRFFRNPTLDSSVELQSGSLLRTKKNKRKDFLFAVYADLVECVRGRYGLQTERRRQLISVVEASGRTLLDSGTILITDIQDPCPPPTPDGEGDPLASYRGTRLGYDCRGMAFYVPGDHLKPYGDPSGEPWFYPATLTPLQATLFLRAENRRGCFVVYRSPTTPSSDYTLSVSLGTHDVVHYAIVRNPRGDLCVAGHDHSFLSLADLVTYFRRNRGGLACRLLRPLRDARRPVTPGLDFPGRYEVTRSEVTVSSRAATDRPGRLGTRFVGQYRGHAVVVRVMRPSPDLLHRPDVEDEMDQEFISQVCTVTNWLVCY